MPTAFHVELTGLEKLTKGLAGIQRVMANDGQTIKTIIATELFHSTERAFAEKKDPETGQAWKPWSAGYMAWLKKTKKLKRATMLRSSGHLFDSIMHWSDNEGAHIGANLIYAPIHQFGFSNTVRLGPYTVPAGRVKAHKRKGRKIKAYQRSEYTVGAHSRKLNIPARPYLGLDDEAREDITETILDLIDDAFNTP